MRSKIQIALVVIIVALAVVGIAGAQSGTKTLYPSHRLVNTEGELIFEGWFIQNDSMSCIQMSNGNFFCCCGAGCSIEEIEILETVVPKDPTPTPKSPTGTPVIPPTDTPVPIPSDTPEPETNANCGVGNLDEGADPNENACGKKTGEENEPDGPPGQQP